MEFNGFSDETRKSLENQTTFLMQTGLCCMEKSFVDEFEILQKKELLSNKQKIKNLNLDIATTKIKINKANKDILSLKKYITCK